MSAFDDEAGRLTIWAADKIANYAPRVGEDYATVIWNAAKAEVLRQQAASVPEDVADQIRILHTTARDLDAVGPRSFAVEQLRWAADALASLASENAALKARAERLAKALRDAIECVESWSAYADEYYKAKHDLAGDLARLRAALAEEAPDGA